MRRNLVGRSLDGTLPEENPPLFYIPKVDTLPSGSPQGQMFFQNSDKKVYFGNGTSWVKFEVFPIEAVDIADGSVTNPKLATASSSGAANNVVLYDSNGSINTNAASLIPVKIQTSLSTGRVSVPIGSSSNFGYIDHDITTGDTYLGNSVGDILKVTTAIGSGIVTPKMKGPDFVFSDSNGNLLLQKLANAQVDSAAAIDYSKLNLSNSIVAGDITSNAITTTKIAANAVQNANILNGQVDPIKTSFMDAMCKIDAEGNIVYSYGIASSSRSSAGVYIVTFNTTSFMRVINATLVPPGVTAATISLSTPTGTTAQVSTTTSAGTATDCSFFLTSLLFT